MGRNWVGSLRSLFLVVGLDRAFDPQAGTTTHFLDLSSDKNTR
jgi:hypothetical protein